MTPRPPSARVPNPPIYDALRKWLRHSVDCAFVATPWVAGGREAPACTCGLDAAIVKVKAASPPAAGGETAERIRTIGIDAQPLSDHTYGHSVTSAAGDRSTA
jgi:hypothetical protein